METSAGALSEVPACVATGWQWVRQENDYSDLAGMVLLGFFLAVMLAPVVLWRYHRRVQQLMSMGAPERQEQVPPAASHSSPLVMPAPGVDALLKTVDARAHIAYRATLVAAGVFAMCSALVITFAGMFFESADIRSVEAWAGHALYAVIVCVGAVAPIALLQSPNKRVRALLLVPFALLIGLIVEDVWLDQTMPLGERFALLGAGTLGVAILYLALIGRRLRNVVPVLSLYLATLLGALYVAGVLIEVLEPCDFEYVDWVITCVGIAAVWGITRAGLGLLGRLTQAYEDKAFSESQLQMGLWFVIVALVLATDTTPDDDEVMFSRWSLGIALAAILAVLAYVRALRLQRDWAQPQAMLLLRVFSSHRGTTQLLDDVTHRWSFIGPIHLVAGPDLARQYLEPHELLLFLRRRVREQFILSHEDLSRRLNQLEDTADPDGRFRINEFFCQDDTWQLTVDRLVERAPVILLDLRGFNSARAGTAFEVALLARKGALGRTVFLQDRHTDTQAVDAALAEVPGARIAPERIFYLERSPEVTEVLRRLADCL